MIAYPLRIVTIRKLMMLALIVVADQADVNGYQKHENQGLYKTNQHFHKVKGNRQNPINLGNEVKHAVKKTFATENIAKKAKSQGNRTEKDGKYFNKAYGDEDNSQKQKHDGWYVSFLRLVAEQVLHDDFDTRIFEDQIEPGDIGDEGKRKRHVKVRIGGANQWFFDDEMIVDDGTVSDGSHSRQ